MSKQIIIINIRDENKFFDVPEVLESAVVRFADGKDSVDGLMTSTEKKITLCKYSELHTQRLDCTSIIPYDLANHLVDDVGPIKTTTRTYGNNIKSMICVGYLDLNTSRSYYTKYISFKCFLLSPLL